MHGKSIRMDRITDRSTGNAVIIPMDHGMTRGPMQGLSDLKLTVDQVAQGGATAVLMHKGLVRYGYRGYGRDIGLIMHLSASTDMGTHGSEKTLVTSVEEALRAGADAVSVHINFGAENEQQVLESVGEVSRSCAEWGMPLMIMAYPRGPKVSNEYDPEAIAHCARAAAELGADIVKVSYTGDIDSFREVCRGALAPVVIAGGPKTDSDIDILRMVHDAMEAGGKGVSMGRNVFQNSNVRGMAEAVSGIVLKGLSVEEAAELLRR